MSDFDVVFFSSFAEYLYNFVVQDPELYDEFLKMHQIYDFSIAEFVSFSHKSDFIEYLKAQHVI